MRYTLETFEQELKRRFPNNKIKVLVFTDTNGPIKYQCLECGAIYEKSRASHIYENKTLCQKCYTARKSQIRDWIIQFINNSQQFDFAEPWERATTTRVELHCNQCNRNFTKQPSNLYKRAEHTICPYCGDNGAPTLREDFFNSLSEDKQEEYEILKYTAKGNSVTFRHKKCGYVFSQLGLNFNKGKGCPKCYGKRSKGELKIEAFLKKKNVEYEIEKRFPDIQPLSFDFYLPKYNYLIEYQGEQHYFPVKRYGGEEHFKRQVQLDEKKRQYVKQNNFNYLEIPYNDYDCLEEKYLIPLLSSTTSLNGVASSEAKEKTLE